MAKFCRNCGNELVENSNVCDKCGTAVNNTTVTTTNTSNTNGLAIAGFVISLVSSLLCCGSFSFISLIFSIVGLVNAKKCDGNGKGMAIAGIIISAIGMILLIALYALGIFASIVDSTSSYSY